MRINVTFFDSGDIVMTVSNFDWFIGNDIPYLLNSKHVNSWKEILEWARILEAPITRVSIYKPRVNSNNNLQKVG